MINDSKHWVISTQLFLLSPEMFSVGGVLKNKWHESLSYQKKMTEGNSSGILCVCMSRRGQFAARK